MPQQDQPQSERPSNGRRPQTSPDERRLDQIAQHLGDLTIFGLLGLEESRRHLDELSLVGNPPRHVSPRRLM
jgi:hypothetical protein